jgi:hypothetical protein
MSIGKLASLIKSICDLKVMCRVFLGALRVQRVRPLDLYALPSPPTSSLVTYIPTQYPPVQRSSLKAWMLAP